MRQSEQNTNVTQMNSLDTPLGTVQKQTKVQKELQQPFIVLGGKNVQDIG